MDPNANLAEIRELTSRLLKQDQFSHENEEDGIALAEFVEALDQWLSAGGFLPKDWQR